MAFLSSCAGSHITAQPPEVLFLCSAGYMALTLLVESGWLGSAWAGAKAGAARCWRGLGGEARMRKGAADAGGNAEGGARDEERGLLAEGTLPEDEDVRAERVALQAGTLLT